jgi:hypothetical protein
MSSSRPCGRFPIRLSDATVSATEGFTLRSIAFDYTHPLSRDMRGAMDDGSKMRGVGRPDGSIHEVVSGRPANRRDAIAVSFPVCPLHNIRHDIET